MKSSFKRVKLVGRWLAMPVPYLMIVAVAVVVMWPIATSHTFVVSHDTVFHMNQFYESAMQLKTGHFSWFLTLFGFHQTGRIVNAVYGPVFSYLMGGLLCLCGSWARFQMTTSLAVMVIGGALMYHLLRSCHLSWWFSLILGIIYMNSYSVMAFVDSWSFTGIGGAVTPLVILVGLNLWRNHQVHVFSLALLITVICQIHLLSTLLAVIILIPFAIVSFLGSHQKLTWLKDMACSIGMTILLTGDIWGSLLEVHNGNHIILPAPNTTMTNKYSAVRFVNGYLSFVNRAFIGVVILTIAVALLVLIFRKLDGFLGYTLIMGMIFTWLASGYFPWSTVQAKFPVIEQVFQYPDRLISLSTAFLLVTLGVGLQKLMRVKNDELTRGCATIFAVLTFLIAGFYVGSEFSTKTYEANVWRSNLLGVNNNYHAEISAHRLRQSVNTNDLSKAVNDFTKPISDYLPSNQNVNYANFNRVHPYGADGRQLIRKQFLRDRPGLDMKTFVNRHSRINPQKFVRGRSLVLRWRQPRSLNRKLVLLPVVKYANTEVVLNHQPLNRVQINKIGAIQLWPRAGVNRLILRYQPSLLFKLIVLATILSWLGMLWLSVRWLVIKL